MTINGIRYAPKQVVCFGMDDVAYEPSFGLIIQCLVTGEKENLFVMQILDTVCWNRHLHAFEVKISRAIKVLKYDDLIDHHPLHLCKKINSCFVSLKYFLTQKKFFLLNSVLLIK